MHAMVRLIARKLRALAVEIDTYTRVNPVVRVAVPFVHTDRAYAFAVEAQGRTFVVLVTEVTP